MKYLFSFILVISSVSFLFGQAELVNIQKIKIDNEFILKKIDIVVKNEIDSDKDKYFFKRGLGYLNVFISDYSHGDTILKVRIIPELSGYNDDMPDSSYPLFYGLVNKRPVLLFMQTLEYLKVSYSAESKKRFRNWLEPYFEKQQKKDFYNEDGIKVFTDEHFRIDYFKFGGGQDFYLLKSKYD